LPALPRHELEQRAGILPPPEEEVEDLIDEGVVAGQREAGEAPAGDALEQAALEARADTLDDQAAQAGRIACCELQRQDAAKRHAEDRRALQPEPADELGEVLDQFGEPKSLAQRERVFLAAELVADDTEIAREQTRQRSKQLKPAGQTRHEHERRPFAPLLEGCGVVPEMGTAGLTGSRTELCPTCRQPIEGCLHAPAPLVSSPVRFSAAIPDPDIRRLFRRED